MGFGGPAPFYSLQDIHAVQGAPTDPTGDMNQYDTQSVGQMPDVNAQYAAAANAWQHSQAPEAAPMGAQMAPQPAPPPTQPGPMTAPPVSPMGPIGPVNTPPPTGDLTANVPDLQSRMQQYLDMAHKVYGGMKQIEYGPGELHERPNAVARILADVGTFGLQEAQWAQRDAARSQYNLKVRQHNAEMDMKAFDAARSLMTADQNAQLAQARFGQAQHEFTIKQLRDQATQNDKKLNDYMKQVEFAYKYPGMPFPHPADIGIDPVTPSSTAPTAGAPGELAGPTNAYEPPAPGSPLAESSTGGAPAPPTAAASAAPAAPATGGGPRPGELPFDFAQRRKGEAAAAAAQAKEAVTTTASTRTMKEAAPKVLNLVDQVEKDLKGVTAGPLASRIHEFKAGTLGMSDPAWIRYRTNAGLLQTLLMRMHVGSRGSEAMMKKFRDLIDQGKQSPENMQAALDEIRAYAHEVGGISETTNTTTPTSEGPPATTSGSSIEDILKKHGY